MQYFLLQSQTDRQGSTATSDYR